MLVDRVRFLKPVRSSFSLVMYHQEHCSLKDMVLGAATHVAAIQYRDLETAAL